jgi:hypothetical protein
LSFAWQSSLATITSYPSRAVLYEYYKPCRAEWFYGDGGGLVLFLVWVHFVLVCLAEIWWGVRERVGLGNARPACGDLGPPRFNLGGRCKDDQLNITNKETVGAELKELSLAFRRRLGPLNWTIE